jgi:hypothetical protein
MITIPTLSQLYASTLSDLEAQYGISIPLIGKNYLRGLAAVQAAKLKLYYLAIGNLQKNIFVDTAESESIGGTLERFGRVKLGRNPFAAVAAQYELTITGTIGQTIPASSTFKSDDTATNAGVIYVLDSAYTLVATTDAITVRALTPGDAGALGIGDTLTPTQPLVAINSGPGSCVVASEIVEPLEAETLEAYRAAIIASYRLEAQGGSAGDYRLWAQDAQGVAAVYPYARAGYPCQINLYVEATQADSTDGKGTPSAAILADVEDVVDMNPDTTIALLERGRRPLQVVVNYLAITPKTVNITITGYTGVTAAQQVTILAALTTLIDSIRPFIAAADVLSERNDTLDVNKIIAAIITDQPGAVFTSVSFTVDAVSQTTYTFTAGNIPATGTVTYA